MKQLQIAAIATVFGIAMIAAPALFNALAVGFDYPNWSIGTIAISIVVDVLYLAALCACLDKVFK